MPVEVWREYQQEQDGSEGTHIAGTVYHLIVWSMGYNYQALRLNSSLKALHRRQAQLRAEQGEVSTTFTERLKSFLSGIQINTRQIALAGAATVALAYAGMTYIGQSE